MKKALCAMLVALSFAACDDARIYERNEDFDDRFWPVAQQPEFEFSIADTALRYTIKSNIRNAISYPYARLYMRWSLLDSSNAVMQQDLSEAYLFDKKTGKPFGDSGLGDIYDQRITLVEDYAFPYPGKYKVRLEQYMRADSLQGVLAVGVRVEKASPED